MSAIEVGYLWIGHEELKFSSSGSSYNGWSSGPNAANGVGVKHDIYNGTDKIIKYVTFVYTAFNAVGDPVQCQIKNDSDVSCKLTGPFNPDNTASVAWDCLWYNPTVHKVKIKEVTVIYMDGSEETIPGDEIMSTSSKDSVYQQKHGEEIKKRAEERQKREEENKAKKEEEEKQSKEKTKSILAYIGILVLIPLFTEKESEFVRFHTNQGLILAIIEVAMSILSTLLATIPFVGMIPGIISVVAIVFAIIGIVSVTKYEKKELPILGKIKIIK